MPLEDSHAAADWLRFAERDLRRVDRCLAVEDPELASFCLQQAAEKFLKAFLLSRGVVFRRIHDLEALLDDAIPFDPALEQFRGCCQSITKYYTIERYPLPVEPANYDRRNPGILALTSAACAEDPRRDRLNWLFASFIP